LSAIVSGKIKGRSPLEPNYLILEKEINEEGDRGMLNARAKVWLLLIFFVLKPLEPTSNNGFSGFFVACLK
jgi:hypothetical protein